jgi:hypothetical protein
VSGTSDDRWLKLRLRTAPEREIEYVFERSEFVRWEIDDRALNVHVELKAA